MRIHLAFAIVLMAAAPFSQLRAQTVHDHGSEAALGTVTFENSGAPEAQDAFLRGVLLLHSFEYQDALTAFREAQKIDPDFVLAYWGEAMTHNHPLWSQQDREAALAALAKLAPTPEERLAKAPTAREKAFLEAVELLYGEGDKAARDRAYREAMRRMHEAYPEDHEIAAFYALSILGSVPVRDFRTYMEAASVAEEVFAANPDHPGAAHYLIHSYDDPVHAPLGLRAASRYSRIAPAASHAQHMVSHIYTALGYWDEVVKANEQAVAVSEERLRRMGQPLTRRNKHALLWLMYGLLQQGRHDAALEKLRLMDEDAKSDPSSNNVWHHAAMRAAYAADDPLQSDLPPSLGKARALSAIGLDAFATGYQAAAKNDMAAVRDVLNDLRSAIEAARPDAADQGLNAYDGATNEDDLLVAGIIAAELEAILAHERGDTAHAISLLEEAAAQEAARPLEYGPPTVPKPSAELLGEMLLEAGRTEEAAVYFQKTLERNTGRALSLTGLENARKDMGR